MAPMAFSPAPGVARIDSLPRAYGAVSALAGGGSDCVDGVGAAAKLLEPVGLAVNSSGEVYLADTHGRTFRKIWQ